MCTSVTRFRWLAGKQIDVFCDISLAGDDNNDVICFDYNKVCHQSMVYQTQTGARFANTHTGT